MVLVPLGYNGICSVTKLDTNVEIAFEWLFLIALAMAFGIVLYGLYEAILG